MNRLVHVLILTTLCGTIAYGQICDFNTYSSTPTLSYHKNDGGAYTTWTPGSNNWEIVNTSQVGSPTGSPYVLHFNPGLLASSPQWLTSDNLVGMFNWQFNEMQWSFWIGRSSVLSFNG